ncbi:MAG: hypothetical protein BWY81_00073 [Firmicutes bacterium ADurb.Bin467]|jgi:hypothetical protein|nr:MAG: hypothetical protein BWY81_00073 [Firmicutes bacterium ADurb.Bin467]
MRNPPVRGRNRATNRKAVLCLLVCFPYGLLLMWRSARWHPAVKLAITACFVLLTAAVLLPQTSPPARVAGGVELVGAKPDAEVFGPELPKAYDVNYRGYGIPAAGAAPVLSEIEEVAERYVYANENGRYYHKVDCKYVAWYSVKLTPAVAHFSGYLPCAVCGVEPYQPG